jgi:diguanylate cyclase (GGDEF)-like protein
MPVPPGGDTPSADLKRAFERVLPRRLDAILRRVRLFRSQGWDINGLSLLYEDVQRLTGASGTYGLLEISETLLRAETQIGSFLFREALPDDAAAGQIEAVLEELAPAVGVAAPVRSTPRPIQAAAPVAATHAVVAPPPLSLAAPGTAFGHAEFAPEAYWRRWSGDAPPPSPVVHPPKRPLPAALDPAAAAASESPQAEAGSFGFDAYSADFTEPVALQLVNAGFAIVDEVEQAPVLREVETPAAEVAAEQDAGPETLPAQPAGEAAAAASEADFWDLGAPPAPPASPAPAAPSKATPAAAPAPPPRAPGLVDDAAQLVALRKAGGASGAAPITRVEPRPAPAPSVPAPVAAPRERLGRVYHLSDGSALAVALDQRLEALGYELEILDDAGELCEVLAALPPDAVVVNAGFLGALEGVGEVLRAARKRTGARIPLLALADEDSVQGRLAARRAGADAFLPSVGRVEEVTSRLGELLMPEHEEAYRVMVVEDDRSQALFAESILRKAGMDVCVVCDAMQVIGELERFKPDLILMDLYMPQVDGAELTSLIREREGDIATPIVFLSGEHDADKQLEALTAGGDDFLSKPIRPKHLIAAVSNRVRRARALIRQGSTALPDPREGDSGLYRRAFVLERINEALAEEDVRQRDGGVLFLDIDGALALRERVGLTVLESLLTDVGRHLVLQLKDYDLPARYGEGSFFVLAPERDEAALEALAVELRGALMTHPFQVEGRPLRLRIMVGICSLRHGFADAGSALNTAERACREARRDDSGVHVFAPRRRVAHEAQKALLERVRHAIERDGFDLLYQPIVPLQGGEQAQYQTLVRLRDETGRVYTAAEIIPLAKEAGLIADVDRWVLAHAMDVLAQRRQQGSPVRLFVSQAGHSLCMADQAEWILAQLARRNVPGDMLALELPLSELDSDVAPVLRLCRALVGAGVHLCLSQYESNPLAEGLLEQLPIDYLKLSPRYLAAARTQAVRDELMNTIEQAHRRGINVIAHRVEDAQSAATLWIAGIDYLQGNMVQQAGDTLEFDFQTAVL